MFDMQHSGRVIAKARLAKNMTQMALADALGISYQAVSSWERGLSMPDVSKLPELCELLDLPIDELLGKKSRLIEDVLNDGDFEDVTAEEILEAAPLLEPMQMEKVVEKVEQKIDWKDILPMMGYLSEDFCNELFLRAVEERLDNLPELARYAWEDTVDEVALKLYREKGFGAMDGLLKYMTEDSCSALFREAAEKGDYEHLPFLAKYAFEDTVGEAARKIYREKGLGAVEFLLKYMTEDVVQEFAEEEYAKNGIPGLVPLARHLPEDYLTECAAEAFAKDGFRAVEPIAKYIDSEELEKYIREKYF